MAAIGVTRYIVPYPPMTSVPDIASDGCDDQVTDATGLRWHCSRELDHSGPDHEAGIIMRDGSGRRGKMASWPIGGMAPDTADDVDIRLACLELAIRSLSVNSADSDFIRAVAQQFYEFATAGR